MIVFPNMAMRMLMQQIVEASHGLTNEIGDRVSLGTIEEKTLRMAAITALQIATGLPVWPGDEKIVIASAPRRVGIFEYPSS